MIRSFTEFINESYDKKENFIEGLARSLTQKGKKLAAKGSSQYEKVEKLSFSNPFTFSFILEIRWDPKLNVEQDSHFNNLPWEQLNYAENGFVIDANTHVRKIGKTPCVIIVTSVLNPSMGEDSYIKFYARLLDILTHELNHVEQLGVNSSPFTHEPSNPTERDMAKKSYRYFLLRDEVESMVEGFYARSKELDIPLDEVFDDYLEPFLKTDYISPKEYSTVIQTWVKYALERYPHAIFSKKVEKIVNSI